MSHSYEPSSRRTSRVPSPHRSLSPDNSEADLQWSGKANRYESTRDALSKDQWNLIRDHVTHNGSELRKIKQDLGELFESSRKQHEDMLKVRKENMEKMEREVTELKKQIEEAAKAYKTDHVAEEKKRANGDDDIKKLLERSNAEKTGQIQKLGTDLQDLRSELDQIMEDKMKKHRAVTDELRNAHANHKELVQDQIGSERAARDQQNNRAEAALAQLKHTVDAANEALAKRITDLELRADKAHSQLAADMDEKELKIHAHMKDAHDQIRSKHDEHRSAVSDHMTAEKAQRESGLEELQNRVNRLLNEEKAAREKGDKILQANLDSKLNGERQEREAGDRALADQVAAVRAKCDENSHLIQKKLEAKLDADAVGDLKNMLANEKRAREALEARLAEETKERENRDHALEQQLGGERAKREDMHTLHQGKLSAHEAKTQAELNNVKDLLGHEKRGRDTLESRINDHKQEHDAKHAGHNDTLNSERSKRDDQHNALSERMQGVDSKIQDLLDRERAAREGGQRELADQIHRNNTQAENAIQNAKDYHGQALADHARGLEAKLDRHKADHDATQERVSGLERQGSDHSAKHNAHDIAFDREKGAREARLQQLQDDIDGVKNREQAARESLAREHRDNIASHKDKTDGRLNDLANQLDQSHKNLQANHDQHHNGVQADMQGLRELMGHERAARENGLKEHGDALKNHQDRLGKLEREIADAHDKHGKLEGQQANHKQTGDQRIDELERKVDREEGDRKGDVYDLRSLIGGDAYARAQADPRATSPKLNGGAPKAAPKKEVSTTTTKPHAAGETKLDVKNTQGFKVGDRIMIGAEVKTVKGFGSLILDSPLQYSHPAGTTIRAVPVDSQDDRLYSDGSLMDRMKGHERDFANAQEMHGALHRAHADMEKRIGDNEEAHGRNHDGHRKTATGHADRLDALEKAVPKKIKEEKDGREADVVELRDLINGEQKAREGHRNDVQRQLEAAGAAAQTAHDEHRDNHQGTQDKLGNLNRSLEDRLRQLEKELQEESDVLRDLIGGGKMSAEANAQSLRELLEEHKQQMNSHIADVGKEHQGHAAYAADLHRKIDDLGDNHERHKAENNNRFDASHATMMSKIDDHRQEVDGKHSDLHSRWDDLHGKHGKHAGSVEDRLDELEQEMEDEKNAREADVYELRDLLGGERLAREAHAASVENLVDKTSREFSSRRASVKSSMQQLVESQQVQKTQELGGFSRTLQDQKRTEEQHFSSVQERLLSLEKQLFDASEQTKELNKKHQESEQALQEHGSARNKSHMSLQERLVALENDLETKIQAEQGTRKADVYELRELIVGEGKAREGQLGQVNRDMNGHRDNHNNHKQQTEGKFGEFEERHKKLTEHMKTRMGEEQQARKNMHDNIVNLLAEEREARNDHHKHFNGVLSQEAVKREAQEANLSGQIALERAERELHLEATNVQARDAVDQVRTQVLDVKDQFKLHATLDHVNKVQDTVSQERSDREIRAQADDAKFETLNEQFQNLERQSRIFDGLVRAERGERCGEVQRIWDALDTHTHDLSTQQLGSVMLQQDSDPASRDPLQQQRTTTGPPSPRRATRTSGALSERSFQTYSAPPMTTTRTSGALPERSFQTYSASSMTTITQPQSASQSSFRPMSSVPYPPRSLATSMSAPSVHQATFSSTIKSSQVPQSPRETRRSETIVKNGHTKYGGESSDDVF